MKALSDRQREVVLAAFDLAIETWEADDGDPEGRREHELDIEALKEVHALVFDHRTKGYETIIAGWSRLLGDCQDCGLPAAFTAGDQVLCSVCAANAAASGESVKRIEEEV